MNVFQVAQAMQQVADRGIVGISPSMALLTFNDLVDRVVFSPLADESLDAAERKKLKDLKSRYDCGWRVGLQGLLPNQITAPLLQRNADENAPVRKTKTVAPKTRLKPATRNKRGSCIKVVIRRLVKLGYMETNPAERLDSQPERNQRSRILRDEEVAIFNAGLEQMPLVFRLFMRFTLLSSLRMGEVLACRWSAISIERREILIPRAKSGKPRVVPISDGLADVIRQLAALRGGCDAEDFLFPGKKPGTHMSRPNRQLNKLRDLTGLHDLWVHDLRRTASSWSLRAGSSVHDIGAILGHSDVKVTERYLVAHNPRLHAAMQGADQIYQQLQMREA